jgi:hypothetical protein
LILLLKKQTPAVKVITVRLRFVKPHPNGVSASYCRLSKTTDKEDEGRKMKEGRRRKEDEGRKEGEGRKAKEGRRRTEGRRRKEGR